MGAGLQGGGTRAPRAHARLPHGGRAVADPRPALDVPGTRARRRSDRRLQRDHRRARGALPEPPLYPRVLRTRAGVELEDRFDEELGPQSGGSPSTSARDPDGFDEVAAEAAPHRRGVHPRGRALCAAFAALRSARAVREPPSVRGARCWSRSIDWRPSSARAITWSATASRWPTSPRRPSSIRWSSPRRGRGNSVRRGFDRFRAPLASAAD